MTTGTLAAQVMRECLITPGLRGVLVQLKGNRVVVPVADWSRAMAWAQSQPEVPWSTPTDLVAAGALKSVLRAAGRWALPGVTTLEPGNTRADAELVAMLGDLGLPEHTIRYTRWAFGVEL